MAHVLVQLHLGSFRSCFPSCRLVIWGHVLTLSRTFMIKQWREHLLFHLLQTCWLSPAGQSDPDRHSSSVPLSCDVCSPLTASFWCSSGPEPSQWLSIQNTSQWALYHTIVSARVFGPFINTAEDKHGGNTWLWMGDEVSQILHRETEETGVNGKLIKMWGEVG